MKMLIGLILISLTCIADDNLNHFTKVCSTSASALLSPATKAQKIIIQNPAINTTSVFFGDSTVAISGSTRGIQVDPGDSFSIESSKHSGGNQLLSTAQIYCVAASSQTIVVATIKRD